MGYLKDRTGVLEHYPHLTFAEIVVFDVYRKTARRTAEPVGVSPLNLSQVAAVLDCDRKTVRLAKAELVRMRYLRDVPGGVLVLNFHGDSPEDHGNEGRFPRRHASRRLRKSTPPPARGVEQNTPPDGAPFLRGRGTFPHLMGQTTPPRARKLKNGRAPRAPETETYTETETIPPYPPKGGARRARRRMSPAERLDPLYAQHKARQEELERRIAGCSRDHEREAVPLGEPFKGKVTVQCPDLCGWSRRVPVRRQE